MKNRRKRNPMLALMLSLFVPGLGHLYNGQSKRGAVIYLSGLLLTLIFFSGFYSKFYFLVMFLTIGIFLLLFAIFDAFYQANKENRITLKFYNRWYVYFAIALCHFALIAFSAYLDLIPIKPYRIPSSSMAPSLLPGDYFLIDKRYYDRKEFQRGDIVVFRSPVNASLDFIKRIVGLPGETVEIVNNKVFINKIVLSEPYLNSAEFQDSQLNLYTKKNIGPLKIPEDCMFVLGDNRAGSYDSRHYKFVKLYDVKGKAMYLIWARDKSRIGREIK